MIRKSLSNLFSLPALFFALVLWMSLSLLLHEVLHVSLSTINVVTLIVVTVGCLGTAAVTVANEPINLWFPMSWFLITSAIYYGFGPLLYYFGSPETIAYVDAYYPVNDFSLFHTNFMSIGGIAGVIAVYIILKKAFPTHVDFSTDKLQKRVNHWRLLRRVALVFMAVGIPVKILFVLPRVLGLWDTVLPGALEYFSVLSTLALVPLFLLFKKEYPKYRIAFVILLCFEIITAFVQLNKLEILKIGIVLVLAGILRGINVRWIAWISVFLFFVYAIILTPLITYGRITFNVMGLTRGSEAAQLIQEFAVGSAQDELASILPGVQGWWSRLNYANAQAFAVDSYDAKATGDTFELAMWVVVPRVFYPNKPVTTTGDKFNELVTGDPQSKSAPGMFAEGYWNLGWMGVFFVVLVMSSCYWGWERYTRKRIESFQLNYLPVMWIGLFTAIQQDSWFVPSTLGAIPIAITFHWLAKLVIARYLSIKKVVY